MPTAFVWQHCFLLRPRVLSLPASTFLRLPRPSLMPASSSSFPSSSCFGTFFGLGGGRGCGFSSPGARRAPPMPPPPYRGRPGCSSRLDRAVAWVGNGFAAAFFASLERCSCVNIATDDDRDEARDLVASLIHDDGNVAAEGLGGIRTETCGRIRRRRSGRGKGQEGFDF